MNHRHDLLHTVHREKIYNCSFEEEMEAHALNPGEANGSEIRKRKKGNRGRNRGRKRKASDEIREIRALDRLIDDKVCCMLHLLLLLHYLDLPQLRSCACGLSGILSDQYYSEVLSKHFCPKSKNWTVGPHVNVKAQKCRQFYLELQIQEIDEISRLPELRNM